MNLASVPRKELEQFVELVKRMRVHQVCYFNNGRQAERLQAAKAMEKEVDKALNSFLKQGPRLFEEEQVP